MLYGFLEDGDKLSRRGFLKLGALTAAAMALPARAAGNVILPEKTLSFYNTHTGEKLKTVYCCYGEYRPHALDEINHLLRDYRSGEVKPIAPWLLDLLYDLSDTLDNRKPFHIISGYRSPKTNTALRKSGRGVARYSLHMKGMAVDIRIPGVDLSTLRKAAVRLRRGGVGYYPKPDFVHMDVGRVRYW
jgi:uncharacterized protein YcbK (DUF882 family)